MSYQAAAVSYQGGYSQMPPAGYSSPPPQASPGTAAGVEWELENGPTDGISNLSILNNVLLVSSWDGWVRLYDLVTKVFRSGYQHKAAVLDCCFQDRSHCFSGGLDTSVKMFDVNTSTELVVGAHDKAVKCVDFNSSHNVLVSAGWDSNLKLWDTRQESTLLGSYKQPERVYTLSQHNEKIVVGCAGRHVQVYDIRNMEAPLQTRESALKYQTRVLRCFPNGEGFAIASTEGRVAIEYFDMSAEVQAKKYAFKCHRAQVGGVEQVYPVNAIAFHQGFGTFATGGCDGFVSTWDGNNKKRLAQYPKYPTSISALAFSEDGTQLAIASSYTYEEGEKDHPSDQVFIRTVQEAEIKPKQKTAADTTQGGV